MSKIKGLIVYFLKNSPRTLGKTDIMKHLYCFEYYFYQKYGKQYSDLNFTRYKFGPSTPQLNKEITDLQGQDFVNVFNVPSGNGRVFYAHEFNHSMEVPDEYNLSAESEYVASFITRKLGHSKYEEVIDFAYSTPPMSYLLQIEEEQGILLHGKELDMGMSKEVFKVSRKRRESARLRMQNREKVRGSDSEYYTEYIQNLNKYEDTRRRVNQCLN